MNGKYLKKTKKPIKSEVLEFAINKNSVYKVLFYSFKTSTTNLNVKISPASVYYASYYGKKYNFWKIKVVSNYRLLNKMKNLERRL